MVEHSKKILLKFIDINFINDIILRKKLALVKIKYYQMQQ